MKEVSFCISVKNRLDQISKTLITNLNDNYSYREKIEFVLVDFSSTDHLQSWVLNNFKEELNTGYLTYFYTDELEYWHMSVAKNTAHLYSTGNVCVNLDCDNYTGKNGGAYIMDFYKKKGANLVLHQFSGQFRDGTCGRISMLKKHFNELGGYNEAFEPAGYQDIDLLQRAIEYNLNYVNISDSKFNAAIKNTKDDCVKLCNTNMKWQEMECVNRSFSKNNLIQGILTANCGSYGIRKNVFQYYRGEFINAIFD